MHQVHQGQPALAAEGPQPVHQPHQSASERVELTETEVTDQSGTIRLGGLVVPAREAKSGASQQSPTPHPAPTPWGMPDRFPL
jgi:hypothetical protein